jgi:uncharacterized protein
MTSEFDPDARNVLGDVLVPCSMNPLTGYFRDGCCATREDDVGTHVVCCRMTEGFLRFSKSRGNDLSTPMPQYRFPGLKEGDWWCLCALRWQEAHEAGFAPQVTLASTHAKALDYIALDSLLGAAIDNPN